MGRPRGISLLLTSKDPIPPKGQKWVALGEKQGINRKKIPQLGQKSNSWGNLRSNNGKISPNRLKIMILS